MRAHKCTSTCPLSHRYIMTSTAPRTGQIFFLAKKSATLAIQRKPLYLFLRGTKDYGPCSSTLPVSAPTPPTSLFATSTVNATWGQQQTKRQVNHKSDAKLKKATVCSSFSNVALRPQRPYGRGAHDDHLAFHTTPELRAKCCYLLLYNASLCSQADSKRSCRL